MDKKTYFAPPERSSSEMIAHASERILREELLVTTLNVFPESILLLDRNRQAVFVNKKLLDLTGIADSGAVLGKRPGEIFQCVRAGAGPSGCGTGEECRQCGAVLAILEAQGGRCSEKECRLRTVAASGGCAAFDLRVWASPFAVGPATFALVTLKDIHDEKRREVLERIFFHDLMNETGGVYSFSLAMAEGKMPCDASHAGLVHTAAKRMVELIRAQKDLRAAERGEYVVMPEKLRVRDLLEELIRFVAEAEYARDKTIELERDDGIWLVAERNLLFRVLLNLLKNALEATGVSGVVRIGCKRNGARYLFYVHNAAVIPEPDRLSIFQRSFSTKGAGRGIGTYGAKLFTERYLGGRLWFESGGEQGTTFFVEIL
ncbi:MAG: HAMP domain-containing histidine kinase [Candidatus Omnitrophica bacterium]|nr:HAMP domain-containing histidine kinase [Candidatus Omnitrophota bacterium]